MLNKSIKPPIGLYGTNTNTTPSTTNNSLFGNTKGNNNSLFGETKNVFPSKNIKPPKKRI